MFKVERQNILTNNCVKSGERRKMKVIRICIIIGLCVSLLLLGGCDGAKTFESDINKECEDICVENKMNLDYAIHSKGQYLCHCRKSFLLQREGEGK